MTDRQSPKISIARLVSVLSSFMTISFILCVIAGYILPGLRHLMPLNLIPGFSWANPLTVALGLLWSIGFGAYVAILFAILHEAFGGVQQRS